MVLVEKTSETYAKMFARFTNEWLIDASLYAYFKGVPCCSPASVAPDKVSDGVTTCIGFCQDIPCLEILTEVLHHAPWAEDIKEELWQDRVLFRRVLRRTRERLQRLEEEERDHLEVRVKERAAQIMKEEHLQSVRLKVAQHFPSFYGAVLDNMLTQIASFSMTELAPDGVTDAELAWERVLSISKTDNKGEVALFFFSLVIIFFRKI